MIEPRTLWITLVATLVLAGCAAAPAATPASSSTAVAPPATFSIETGAIAGLVTDDQLSPLAAVEVQLGDNVTGSVRTDAGGAFTFSHITPGSHVLFASKPGYIGSTVRVSVLAGETAKAQLALVPIAIEEPRQESFVDDGFIQLVLAVGSGFVNLGSQAALGTNKDAARRDAAKGNVEVVGTLVWDPTTAASAKWMYLDIGHDEEKENRTIGRSPLTKRVGNLTIEKPSPTFFRFMVSSPCVPARPGPECAEDFPTRLVQVVYEQRLKLYSTFFYVEPGPPGYTAAPPA